MDPSKFSLFQTYEKPKGQGGSGSFATFMIIGPVCFFLGVIFSSFPYDFPLLWTAGEPPAAFYDQLEQHIKLLHASPPIVIRILQIVISVGFCGFFIKLFKPSEANLLFDGSSLILYIIGAIVFISNIIKGYRIVTNGVYAPPPEEQFEGQIILNREDSLKVLAASNTILALILVGVLVLQAGLWYAERREQQEVAKFEAQEHEREVKAAAATGGKNGGHQTRSVSGKKKQ